VKDSSGSDLPFVAHSVERQLYLETGRPDASDRAHEPRSGPPTTASTGIVTRSSARSTEARKLQISMRCASGDALPLPQRERLSTTVDRGKFMRLESVAIKNFRCYREEATVRIDDLTTFVGKNDIGKSSVLEALEIFFNNEVVKLEAGDANVYSGDSKLSITCEFSDLPASLTLDAGAETTLADEHLLTAAGTLKIQKIYDCKSKSPSVEVFLVHCVIELAPAECGATDRRTST
jgi:hypothetical protein